MTFLRYFLFGYLLWVPTLGFGQFDRPDAFDTLKVYKDLQEALQSPGQVRYLDLKRERLDEFPMEILQFKNLMVLDLSRNRLNKLPPEIGQLKNLIDLDLRRNELDTLPREIGQLKNLEYLRLGKNDLSELPEEIADLQSLVVLDIWSNNLTWVPDEMSQMPNLKYIDMRVIQLTDGNKEDIRESLPKEVEIFFSKSCNCY